MSDIMADKQQLRAELRERRRTHAAALPQEVSALVFSRPPRPVIDLIPDNAVIGLYRTADGEAPADRYARFFAEAGHTIALPCITARQASMQFHLHTDPFGESDLVEGPYGIMQPAAGAPQIAPEALFVPLLGFTARGERIGQGAGFYDRWLAGHPDTIAIGMAWDVQEVAELPTEPHDIPLTAIVTPTRLLGPF